MTTALITGATSGIGRAMAVALAEAGYEVYALGRSEVALNELRATQRGITPIALELTDRDSLHASMSGLQVDVLINNAGIMPPLGAFADMAVSDIDSTLEVNLSAAVLLTRLVVPQMRERQSGHILFTGSTAGHAPSPNFAVYSATKAAISAFAASLRAELSPAGIRITEIVPGRVETQLYRDILDSEARQAMYAGRLSLQPEDVAKIVVAVLALPPAAAVTRFDILPTRPVAPININSRVLKP
ncbi:SDR family oxidoreductase [Lichenifustis flavocetrariae]|uniref:SDR family oxidoreductase n=1 Tax=Lichenifustis flavocetrariae TaxID=2949735 RepID=A0AA41ZB12_9HYPH|nr:SDR family oxidoreductase [Lichenifustis flavocetrariae]MCW6512597.1 SDR family oxidoreductase [Lichenifustis flavocetrariae]